jgi:RimJ/RimL family protein N-acetyltransferase
MPFDAQPTLTGNLLALRPLRGGDFDDLFAVASDRLIWEQHPSWDRYKPEVFRALFDEFIATQGTLLAIDRATGGVIGSSRYHGYHAERSEVEIGWTFLARSHWGGRYNGEMKRLMLTHAFRFVDTVVFMIGPDNIRSQKAVLRIGAVPAGSRPNNRGTVSLAFTLSKEQFALGLGHP